MRNGFLCHIKSDWRRVNKGAIKIGAVIILLCGVASSVLTYILGGRSRIYNFINLPLWAPPRFIFPVIWTLMYILIGGATGAVMCSREGFRDSDKYKGLLLFVVMMVFNVIWSPLFFAAYAFFFAFLNIMIMIALSIFTLKYYSRIFYISAAAMVIYIIWLIYLLFLNFSIMLAN
ncbi:MAG: tryptophan-rich sensory protein [Eubacteriales bacterium]|jgi:benzodiazapine receptor|nr:tryptophan-rich sensory protein [Eubacteriales bacterium]